MKTFWAMFFAILAAAAVIWGVWAYNASVQKDTALELQMLETMMRTAKLSAESATRYGSIEELTLNVTLDGARSFEKILRTGRVDHSKARSLAHSYVYDYREVTKFVRESMPQHKKWAEELDALLAKIEATSRLL